MAAWALTAFWRAQELGDTLVESLGKWRVIAAASVARALIEGAAAFVVEARAMTDEWRDMKAAGPPDWTTAHSFRAALNQVLGQAQFGTRLGPDHLSGINKGKHLERTNVLTLLDKFGKITGHPEKVEDWYAWLCDATHPSYGFQAAYTTANLVHVARVQMLVQASTDPAEVRAAEPGATQPTIAHASAEASAFALEQIAEHLPRFIAVVDDYGLTTGVPFVSRLDYFRRLDEPARNDPCPCGSGRKFKACVHAWGSPLLDPRT